MPRRALLLLTALVLILHWLVLVGLPLGGGAGAAADRRARARLTAGLVARRADAGGGAR